MTTDEPCQFLPWDTDFFGYRIAKVKEHQLTSSSLTKILRWCEEYRIDCLYFLAALDEAQTIKIAEDNRFRLVDVRMVLKCHVQTIKSNSYPSQSLQIRHGQLNDVPTLQQIAKTSYHLSRFCFDPGFSTQSCQALYETWVKRSCEGYVDALFVALENHQPIGYVSCRRDRNKKKGQIELLGVANQARGQGLGKTLVLYALNWFLEQNIEQVQVTTQSRNIAAQRLYQRCGFLTESVGLWYHKWFLDFGN